MSHRFLVCLLSLASVGCVLGCNNGDVDSASRELCVASCEREAECVAGITVAECVPDCVRTMGLVLLCDRDQMAMDACIADMASLSCEALEAGERRLGARTFAPKKVLAKRIAARSSPARSKASEMQSRLAVGPIPSIAKAKQRLRRSPRSRSTTM